MSGNWDNGRLWINGINGILFHIALCVPKKKKKKAGTTQGSENIGGFGF